jgi:hypothetical protein
MFDDISNVESDHWNPMSNNPIIPESQPGSNNAQKDDSMKGILFFIDLIRRMRGRFLLLLPIRKEKPVLS